MTTTTLSSSPVIIIGAGRSGTNLLRDIISAMPDYGTWPCDEINYIWRYGNARQPTDEFLPEMATTAVQSFIRAAFQKIAAQQNAHFIVEKTCANSLRVGFVERVLPEARYVHIIRDGRDVVSSAMKRWTAPLDLPYILRKARYVPRRDLPYYGSRYVRNHIHRLSSGEKQLASWGPRFAGMEEALRTRSLAEVCALQWQRCVQRSEEDLAEIPAERLHRLRYEAFVSDPVRGIADLTDFLGVVLAPDEIKGMTGSISAGSVGKWRRGLADSDQDRVEQLLEPTLRYYGYV